MNYRKYYFHKMHNNAIVNRKKKAMDKFQKLINW